MAREQVKVISTAVVLVGLIITIVSIAWASGSKVTAVEKDVEAVQNNATEDRKAIGAVAIRTTALEIEASEARLRDERQANQFTKILVYMETDSKKTDEISGRLLSVQEVQSEQTIINAVNSEKLQQLTKD